MLESESFNKQQESIFEIRKDLILIALRGPFLNSIRNTELYNLYNSKNIPSGLFDESTYNTFVSGLSALENRENIIDRSITDYSLALEQSEKREVKEEPDFDPSRGAFLQYESEEAKSNDLLRLRQTLDSLKKLREIINKK